jgi:hypothetical protein
MALANRDARCFRKQSIDADYNKIHKSFYYRPGKYTPDKARRVLEELDPGSARRLRRHLSGKRVRGRHLWGNVIYAQLGMNGRTEPTSSACR